MEEKIIEAQFTKNKLARITLFVSIGLLCLGVIFAMITYSTGRGSAWFGGTWEYIYLYDSFFEFFAILISSPFEFDGDAIGAYICYLGVLGILMSLFFAWEMSRCALTVTSRKVTGKASFGKSVDLPLNQISAVALGICSRITVATSSGKIHFWFVKNRSEVHSALTDIIGKVQVEAVYNQRKISEVSPADELKKYKELLDSGVITQEEFDEKKKQLLGLQ